LSAKYGAKAAAAASKAAKAPVRQRGGRLPPGIQSGIARLTECYLGVYDRKTNQKQLDGSTAAGELYLRMVGAVVEPKAVSHNGSSIPVEGLQTSQVIPICGNGVSFRGGALDFDACVQEASNELRLIGGEGFSTADFDAAVKALANAKPYFRFSTTESAGKGINPATKKPYEPRTWENWLGSKGLENWKPTAAADAVQEEVPADEEAPDDSEQAADAGAFDEFSDLTALAEKADAGDEEATAAISKVFEDAGKTDEDLSAHGTWVESLVLLEPEGEAEAEAEPEADPEPEPEPEPKKWKKGEAALYKPPVKGPGGKLKPGTKAVKCTVTQTYTNGTADLLGPDKKTKYAKVKQTELE